MEAQGSQETELKGDVKEKVRAMESRGSRLTADSVSPGISTEERSLDLEAAVGGVWKAAQGSDMDAQTTSQEQGMKSGSSKNSQGEKPRLWSSWGCFPSRG